MDGMLKCERIHIANGKNLSVNKHIIRDYHPLHWHSFFEIEIILSGAGKYTVNDIEYDIASTNTFLLTPTDFHYLKINSVTELINISFDRSMLSDRDVASLIFNKLHNAYAFSEDEYKRILNIAELLQFECNINGDCQKILLQYLVRCLLRKNEVLSTSNMDDVNFSGIKKAIIFIELHFREQITQAQVAAEAGYTPTYFSKLLKKTTGESYTQMLARYRLGYARMLLANGLSIADSCFDSGFGSLSNFLETFKKNYGISPSEYRRICNS